MVFQDPDAQIVTGTVYDEVAFGPENLRLPLDEVRARAEDALRRVGLWERRDENPDRLSGGGRQRLAIACALAMGSPLIVLDEPTANLDPQGIDDVYAALADVVAAGDRAILLVEHNLDAAMGFVDRARSCSTAPGASRSTVRPPRSSAAHADELSRWACGSPPRPSPRCDCGARAGDHPLPIRRRSRPASSLARSPRRAGRRPGRRLG